MKNLKIVKNNDLKDWAEDIFKKNSFNMIDVSSKKETLNSEFNFNFDFETMWRAFWGHVAPFWSSLCVTLGILRPIWVSMSSTWANLSQHLGSSIL